MHETQPGLGHEAQCSPLLATCLEITRISSKVKKLDAETYINWQPDVVPSEVFSAQRVRLPTPFSNN
jgi:hypothetical protein